MNKALDTNPINIENIEKKIESKDPVIVELENKVKGLEATNTALKGMLNQLIPVVQVFVPILKGRQEIDQEIIKQIETMLNVSNMLLGNNISEGAI